MAKKINVTDTVVTCRITLVGATDARLEALSAIIEGGAWEYSLDNIEVEIDDCSLLLSHGAEGYAHAHHVADALAELADDALAA